MRAWELASVQGKCGACERPIEIGDPVLFIQPHGLSHAKKRCQSCAGEPAPSVIPQRVEPAAAPRESSGFVQLGRAQLSKALPFDARAAALGEDRE